MLTFGGTYRIYYPYQLRNHRKGAPHEIFLAKHIPFRLWLCDALVGSKEAAPATASSTRRMASSRILRRADPQPAPLDHFHVAPASPDTDIRFLQRIFAEPELAEHFPSQRFSAQAQRAARPLCASERARAAHHQLADRPSPGNESAYEFPEHTPARRAGISKGTSYIP